MNHDSWTGLPRVEEDSSSQAQRDVELSAAEPQPTRRDSSWAARVDVDIASSIVRVRKLAAPPR
jgi:hypothetical protein